MNNLHPNKMATAGILEKHSRHCLPVSPWAIGTGSFTPVILFFDIVNKTLEMKLIKLTDKGRTGNIFSGDDEVLFIDWNNGTEGEFYAIDKKLQLKSVDKDYFARATVGEQYLEIEKQLPSPIHHYISTKGNDGKTYFCFYQEGIIYGFDKKGKKLLEWNEDVGQGHAIYDIKFQAPNYLWLAFPTGQTVSQISLSDKKEVFRIGNYSWVEDEESELLSYPESIFVSKEFLYIPNMGNHKLYKIDLETYEIGLEMTFVEQPWQYLESSFGTFIVTETGIYKMNK